MYSLKSIIFGDYIRDMIQRELGPIIESRLNSGKAIIVLGPRQSGKTTLLETIAHLHGPFLLLDCDDPLTRERLENPTTEQLKQLIGSYQLVFIDEAQRVKNIGVTLKIITDRLREVQLLVSGSSSLELAGEINEPLTGRKWEYMLFPVSWSELEKFYGNLKALQQLETRILYGMYPDVIIRIGDEQEVLRNLAGSYLYKDLLSFKGVRKPELPEKLLRALALQIGNEVSYNELSGLLQVDKQTISTYIDLLEKAFVVFRLQPFSRNLRNEVNSTRKIYFYDTGIRNALIGNFSPLATRQDTGALWENFFLSERMKWLHYRRLFPGRYFWRTTQQQEIDYLEETNGRLTAFELKWSPGAKFKLSKTFSGAYPGCDIRLVHRENFMEFLSPPGSSLP
jgi:predicted AAA+ superfamily ATPase